MSCWGGAGLNRLHSNNSQNVSLLTLPRDYLWIFKVKTLQRDVVFGRGRLTSPSLRHVLQRSCKEMFLMLGCKYITLIQLFFGSVRRFFFYSAKDAFWRRCVSYRLLFFFSLKKHMSYLAIFLIICESLNVSCTDLVKRCLSCWLGGWGRITSPPSRPFLPTTSRHYISATVTFHLLLLFTFEELLPCIFFLFWSESILGIFPQKRNFFSSKSVRGWEKSFRGQKHRLF